jgi:hypothetical protein
MNLKELSISEDKIIDCIKVYEWMVLLGITPATEGNQYDP